MTFEEYWDEVGKLKVLPEMAIIQLPHSLSPESKKRLMKKRPEETVEILRAAISEVNRGSIESIDKLVRRSI